MKPGITAVSLLLVIFFVCHANRAQAQWASVGGVAPPSQDARGLTFRSEHAVVRVEAVAADIIRVRLAPGSHLGRDHSYAVVNRDFGDPHAVVQVQGGRSTLSTPHLRVTLEHQPLRLKIADIRHGADVTLDEDDPEMGMAVAAHATRVWKRLPDEAQVYGFGEKSGRLNKRGRNLGGYSYTMWNTDAYTYDMGTDPLYASVPFFLVLRGGRAHGIFVDNTFRTHFDVGKQLSGKLSFGAEDGVLDYYFIDGPTPKEVVARYSDLTGHMPLPPLWALGLHQCRYSYQSAREVRFVAENFRMRGIPADTLWLDIHHLEGFSPFHVDKKNFPDLKELNRELESQGFHTVAIVDPHLKKKAGERIFASGLRGDHFIKNRDGTLYEAPVWPAQAATDPAPSVFPDFTRPATRAWWGRLLAQYTQLGTAGIWNDMNEPAIFEKPTWTFSPDVRHDNEGEPTDHREIHNVYGQLMSRATFEGLQQLRPNERPFVLTRASFAGGQRYAALWTGDTRSRFDDLRHSLPMLLNLGLSGMPFVGADIGGYEESPTPELFTRWLQAGVFYPFMRVHSAWGTLEQHPWSYGAAYEAHNRRAIEWRYALLPTIYTVMQEASATGIPVLRPLFMEYPDDPNTYDIDDEFFFGSNLLVAPVLLEGATERELYLPEGIWYDFWTKERYHGGGRVRLPVTLSSLPIFVRAGAFVFRQPVVQHTGAMAGQPLEVVLFAAAAGQDWLYEDDGHSLDYQRGVVARRRFSQMRRTSPAEAAEEGPDEQVTVTVDAALGSYRPAARPLRLVVQWRGAPPSQVRLWKSAQGGPAQLLRQESRATLEAQPHLAGWSMGENGFVVVQHADLLEGLVVQIER